MTKKISASEKTAHITGKYSIKGGIIAGFFLVIVAFITWWLNRSNDSDKNTSVQNVNQQKADSGGKIENYSAAKDLIIENNYTVLKDSNIPNSKPKNEEKYRDKNQDQINNSPNQIINNAPNQGLQVNENKGTINYNQNEYKPLDNTIKNKVDGNLTTLIKKYPVHPVVQIEIESGNSQRFKIAEALEIILQPYNLGRFPKNNTFIGRFPDSPISVFVNPSNVEFAKAFMKAINLYVSGDYKVIEIPQWENGGGGMRLYFNGTPSFRIDGSVKVN